MFWGGFLGVFLDSLPLADDSDSESRFQYPPLPSLLIHVFSVLILLS